MGEAQGEHWLNRLQTGIGEHREGLDRDVTARKQAAHVATNTAAAVNALKRPEEVSESDIEELRGMLGTVVVGHMDTMNQLGFTAESDALGAESEDGPLNLAVHLNNKTSQLAACIVLDYPEAELERLCHIVLAYAAALAGAVGVDVRECAEAAFPE
jgi:hypothetical protein